MQHYYFFPALSALDRPHGLDRDSNRRHFTTRNYDSAVSLSEARIHLVDDNNQVPPRLYGIAGNPPAAGLKHQTCSMSLTKQVFPDDDVDLFLDGRQQRRSGQLIFF
jgi:hypothetical protein